MQEKRVAVYGAGGFGREVAWLIEQCSQAGQKLSTVCFIDDADDIDGKYINNIPVATLAGASELHGATHIVAGIGNPKTRQIVIEKAMQAGLQPLTLVHPNIQKSQWVNMGEGTVICAGNILTVNITLGMQVQINLDCTVGHDVVMDDYVTLAPGVHISGNVHLGKRVYIGTGAVIINGSADRPLVVGDDCVIGAAACVTKSVPPGITVVGVPAKPLLKQALS